MHHHRSLLVYCCFGIQLVAYTLVIRREYYQPYPNDPAGAKMKSLRRIMYRLPDFLDWHSDSRMDALDDWVASSCKPGF